MSYAVLSAAFLAAAVCLAVIVVLVSGRRPSAPATTFAIAALLGLTALFDTAMIAAGFFHYDASRLLGVFIGLAPLEDFAYPLAGALLLPAVWTALRARRGAVRTDPEEQDEP